MSRSSTEKITPIVLLLLVLGLSVFYWPWLSGQCDFCYSDNTYYFQPFSTFMAEELKSNRFPLWNPYMYCGMSQIAVPSPGPFYPFTWLHVLLPFSFGLALYLLLHQLVFGIGTFFLIQKFGWQDTAAAAAAITLAFCGYMFCLSSNSTLPATISWLPLGMYALLMVNPKAAIGHARRGELQTAESSTSPEVEQATPADLRWPALSAVAVAMIILAGRAELGFPALLILSFTAIWPLIETFTEQKYTRITRPEMRRALSSSLWRVSSMALGVCLAAPTILPTVEWLSVSPRKAGLDPVSVFTWSANWYDFVCLVLNQPMGDIATLQNDFRGLVASRKNYLPFLTSTYIGPIMGTLAVFGFLNKRWKLRLLAGVLLLFFSIAAAGSNTPLAPAALQVCPLLGAFRYPVKSMIFVAMIISVAAAAGVQMVVDGHLPKKQTTVAFVVWLAVLLFGGSLIVFPGMVEAVQWFPWNQGMIIDIKLMGRAQVLFGQATMTAALVAILGLSVIELYRRGRISLHTFSIILIGLLAGQMLAAALQYARHTAPAGFFQRPSFAVEKINAERKANPEIGRLLNLHQDPLVFPPSFKQKGESFDVSFYQFTRQLLLSNIYVSHAIPSCTGYEAAETNAYKTLLKDAVYYSTQTLKTPPHIRRNDEPMYKFARLTATSLVGTHAYKKSKGKFVPLPALPLHRFKLIAESQQYNYRLYKVQNPRPRAYLADEVRGISAWTDLHKMLVRKEDAINFGRIAWLKESDLQKVPREILENSGIDGTCTIERSDPNDLVIKTDSPRPALLVVADNFYPGWQCFVDSSPCEILCANSINRAVPLAAGRHSVEFKYRPATLMLGIGIALGTVFLLFCWCCLVMLQARRQRS